MLAQIQRNWVSQTLLVGKNIGSALWKTTLRSEKNTFIHLNNYSPGHLSQRNEIYILKKFCTLMFIVALFMLNSRAQEITKVFFNQSMVI